MNRFLLVSLLSLSIIGLTHCGRDEVDGSDQKTFGKGRTQKRPSLLDPSSTKKRTSGAPLRDKLVIGPEARSAIMSAKLFTDFSTKSGSIPFSPVSCFWFEKTPTIQAPKRLHFSSVPCDEAKLPAEQSFELSPLSTTMNARKPTQRFEISMRAGLVNEPIGIGEVEVSYYPRGIKQLSEPQTAKSYTLKELCSGPYEGKCKPELKDNGKVKTLSKIIF
jgi:hypothetical protein